VIEHHPEALRPCGDYREHMRETRRLIGALTVDDVPEAGVEDLLAVSGPNAQASPAAASGFAQRHSHRSGTSTTRNPSGSSNVSP
jgi:hypothetical protein